MLGVCVRSPIAGVFVSRGKRGKMRSLLTEPRRHHYRTRDIAFCYSRPVKPIPVASRSAHRILGRSVVRLEDAPLLTGQGAFVGDIGFPPQLPIRVVRSAYAKAVLRSVNVGAALAVPGVVAVWTAADIDDLPPIDFRDPAAEALRPYPQ